MTVDTSSQDSDKGPSTLIHNISLACAVLTVVFAVIALILGAHLATLQANHLRTAKQSATSEAATIQETEANLSATKKSLEAEQKQTEKLRQQIAATMKEMQSVKAELAKANEMLTAFQSTQAMTPSTESATSPKVAPQSASGTGSETTAVEAANPIKNQETTVSNTPSVKSTESPSAADTQATTPPQATDVTEETITEKSN